MEAVRGRNWLAFLVELGIIVLGVAVGLQADNWNERRNAEGDARALIQNLRSEFVSNRAIDYVKDHGSLRNTNHNRVAIDRSALEVRNRPLLSEPTFENYVDEKLMMAQFLADQYRPADELVDEIIGASERYMGGR